MQNQLTDNSAWLFVLHSFFAETYHNTKQCLTAKRKGIKMQDYMFENKADKFPVAMAYVPWQKFDKLYDDLEKAYNYGTIFPELNKPFTGRRCV